MNIDTVITFSRPPWYYGVSMLGSPLAIVLVIAGFIVFFYARKKKNINKNIGIAGLAVALSVIAAYIFFAYLIFRYAITC